MKKKSKIKNKRKKKYFKKFPKKLNFYFICKKLMGDKNKKKQIDFSKFNTQNLEYELEKTLTHYPIDKNASFVKRMEYDIMNRRTKSERRKKLISYQKPKKKEEERLAVFNRLIGDSNRRIEIKENMENLNSQLNKKYVNKQKKSINKWNQIYEKRFMDYKRKIEEDIRNKVIEKEKESKNKEDKVVEEINQHIKKVSFSKIDNIVNRLWQEIEKSNFKKDLKFSSIQNNINNNKKSLKKNNSSKYKYIKSKIYSPNNKNNTNNSISYNNSNNKPYKSNKLLYKESNKKEKIVSSLNKKNKKERNNNLFNFSTQNELENKLDFYTLKPNDKNYIHNQTEFKFNFGSNRDSKNEDYKVFKTDISDNKKIKSNRNKKSSKYLTEKNAFKLVDSILSKKIRRKSKEKEKNIS